jgi:hypothetical protein
MRAHRAAQFDLVKTQRIMGHSSPITTALYVQTSQDELDALVLGMDAAPAVAVPAALAAGKLRRPSSGKLWPSEFAPVGRFIRPPAALDSTLEP